MKKNHHLNYLMILNVISAISVVILHTNGCFWTFSKERYWITANIIESIFYFAVPVFFMITGATLIDYQERYTTKEYMKKRIKKTVLPFIFWSIIGMIFYLEVMTNKGVNNESIHDIINSIINTKYISIYWFFPALLCVYLVMPLYSSIDNKKKKTTFLYLITIGGIFNVLIPFINNVFSLNYQLPITITVVSGYMIYPLIGYIINSCKVDKKYRVLIYILGIIGLLLHIIGTWYLSYKYGHIVKTYKGYSNLPCLLYSASIFTFFKYNSEKILNFKLIKNILIILNKYTFAIYLEHFYVMEIIKRFFNTQSIFYRLIIPFAIIIICCIATYIIRKIKYVRNIVPE